MKSRLKRYATGRVITDVERVAIDSIRLRLDQHLLLEISAYRPYKGADAQIRVDFKEEEREVASGIDQLSVERLLRERTQLESEILKSIQNFETRTFIRVREIEATKAADDAPTTDEVHVRLDL